LKIIELDFEIPAGTQKGNISTIEGILRTAAKNLSLYQDERLEQTPEIGSKVQDIILQLLRLSSGDESVFPFHILLDDPAGNSFIQNPNAPMKDNHLIITHYNRTSDQDTALGLQPDKGTYKNKKEADFAQLLTRQFGSIDNTNTNENNNDNGRLGYDEIIHIPSPCPNCTAEGEMLTAVTNIPHFKEVLIIAYNCNQCGYRNNEVKGGGSVPAKGTEVSLTITCSDDLKRDVLKSDSSMVLIPELELELQHGSMGGMYTTVEGLIVKIHQALTDNNPFATGDSYSLHHSNLAEVSETKQKFITFLDNLDRYSKGLDFPFTIILRDPLGNSFISAPLGSFLPPELDKNLTINDFERNFEENEEFGLNDMNTKDYEVIPTNSNYYDNILSDRVTTKTVKGLDHPTVYAKAIPDNTDGGIVFSNLTAKRTFQENLPVDNQLKESYYDGPAGWKFEKSVASSSSQGIHSFIPAGPFDNGNNVSEDFANDELPFEGYGKRIFDEDNDSKLKYLPYETFSGYKPGYVFRLGAKGLGYYEDIKPNETI